MSITHDKNHIEPYQMSRNVKKPGVELPHPPYYNYIKSSVYCSITTYKYYFNSVEVVVIGLNDRTTYHMVLQLYTLLTFNSINI